jgi:DNA-binding CsgD family transcriptional regulator
LGSDGDVWEAGYKVEDMAWVMCQLFVLMERSRYVFSGLRAEKDSGTHSALREVHTAFLAGWVGSKISLQRNKRLSSTLADQGAKPFDALLRELPAATLIGWDDARHEGWIKDFVNCVTRSMEDLGREALIKERVVDAPIEEVGSSPGQPAPASEDEDLAEFELVETLRQQGNQLRAWVEQANFSHRQRRVYELDMQTDFDTKTIAEELGTDVKTVRGHRKRYHDKIRVASEAAGL